jgi:small-conductance mechanosensitive channel
MWTRWLLLLHVLSVITFFLAHGAGAAMSFRMRRETVPERMRAMLDLSGSTVMTYLLAYLLMGLTGITQLIGLRLWSSGWVWVSIGLMLFVFLWMYRISRPYATLRRLVGLPYMKGNVPQAAEPPATDEAIVEHVSTLGPMQFVVVGYVVPAFVLWLMVFKPF